MFDFTTKRKSEWAARLRPPVDGWQDEQGFGTWWAEHEQELTHLHPKLVEQWVYRHWGGTEFHFLPLETLTWELAVMTGDEILSRVTREIAKKLEPEEDYPQMAGLGSFPKFRAADELDQGTWNYPIIALSTPSGWFSKYHEQPDKRLMLVEGHQRHRYLNALHARQTPPLGPHEVFIIHSPVVT